MEGFIFSTVICTSAAESFLISAILDSMRCWLRSTFAFQFINAEISQLPRLVILRISARSGTCLMAFSKWFGNRHHHFVYRLQTRIGNDLYFRKSDFGKKEVCNRLYTKTPPIKISAIITVSGFLYVIKNFFILLLFRNFYFGRIRQSVISCQ